VTSSACSPSIYGHRATGALIEAGTLGGNKAQQTAHQVQRSAGQPLGIRWRHTEDGKRRPSGTSLFMGEK